MTAEPQAYPERHWRSEVFAFYTQAKRRYSPSMRQRIDVDELWRLAREQVRLAYDGDAQRRVMRLPAQSPISVDELLAEKIDGDALLARLQPITDAD